MNYKNTIATEKLNSYKAGSILHRNMLLYGYICIHIYLKFEMSDVLAEYSPHPPIHTQAGCQGYKE